MVFNYIKETGRSLARTAIYTTAVLTLAASAYFPAKARAQEAKKNSEKTPIEILVNTYEKEYAKSKGEKIESNILDLIIQSYQDSFVSREDAEKILGLVKLVQDPDKKKKLSKTVIAHNKMAKEYFRAKTLYEQEKIKADRARGKDKIAILARAEKKLYEALAAVELLLPQSQYAQELRDTAKRGLSLARQYPGLMLTKDFEKYVEIAEQAAVKAKKEKKPLTELRNFTIAIDEAIAGAKAAEQSETKIGHYQDALNLLKEAEKIFPLNQYSSQIKTVQNKIKALQQETTKKPEPAPKLKPETEPEPKPKPEVKPAPKPTLKPEVKSNDSSNLKTADPLPNSSDASSQSQAKDADNSESKAKGLQDILTGKKYNSHIDIGGGMTTEDREGNIQNAAIKIADVLDAKFLRNYQNWTNAADNMQNLRNLSAMIDIKPLAILTVLSKMSPSTIDFLNAGVFAEETKGTEWDYETETVEDTNFRVTNNTDFRNIFTNKMLSAWANIQLADFIVDLANFYSHTTTETKVNSLTINENLNDPDGNYAVAEENSATDLEIIRGGRAGIALRLNNGIKGKIGLLGQVLEEYNRLAGQQSQSKKIYTFGLNAEILTQKDIAGTILAIMQDIQENDTDKLTRTRATASGALNISPIDFGNGVTLDGLLFADIWAENYRDQQTIYGGGAGAMFGDTDKILPQVLNWLADKNLYKIGMKPEISSSMQQFKQRKGFRNLLLTNLEKEWSAAMIGYLEATKEIGLNGRLDSTLSANLAGILNTPPAAFVLSGYYSEGMLEKAWGIDVIAHIKKHGFAVGAGFHNTNYLILDQEQIDVEGYVLIPLGSSPKKQDKK